MITRRQFAIGASALAFSGLARSGLGRPSTESVSQKAIGYGDLVTDPKGILDLPPGFS